MHAAAAAVSDPALPGIVSQSDMVRFLHRKANILGPLADMTLAHLGLAHKPVLTVPGDRPAIDCLRLMHDAGVSAVGVLDTAGRRWVDIVLR